MMKPCNQCHKVRDVECKNVVERSGTDFLRFDGMQKIRLAAPFLHSKPQFKHLKFMTLALQWRETTSKEVTVAQFSGGHFFLFDHPPEIRGIISDEFNVK